MALKNYPSYEKNPVPLKGIISVRKQRTDIGIALVHKNSGEILHDYDVRKDGGDEWVSYDKDSFTKVYHSQLAAMGSLSVTAMKILFYIFREIPKNKDFFSVHVADCMEFCQFKNRVSVYKGLEELLRNNAISRKPGQLEFWINPNGFFNGSRVKYMEDKVKGDGV